MTFTETDHSRLSSIENAERQEEIVDVFNGAVFSIKDRYERKEAVDLLNIFTSLNYYQRLWKFSDASGNRYILNPISTNDEEGRVILSDDELKFIGDELKVIGNFVSDTSLAQPEFNENETEEIITALCEKFTEKEIEQDEYISLLRAIVIKDAEIAYLEQTGRLADTQ